jgi:DNA repair protein RecN (Recombination protein N)
MALPFPWDFWQIKRMLNTLTVRNIALVEKANITFQPGLNVVTGETGAGKSVLMGSLKMLLGERADKSMIRSGETECSAQAVFDLADPDAVNALLEDQGVDACEDGQLIIRRTIKASGSGQNFVNDCPVTLPTLKALGNLLVDMHGPYDHQSLLHSEAQMDILDAFGALDKEDLLDRREALSGNADAIAEQIDLLSYRVKEIDDAEVKLGEEEELREEHTMVGNAQRIMELSSEALQSMSEGEPSAFDLLAQAQRAIDQLSEIIPEAKVWLEEAGGMTTQLRELASTMRDHVERLDADPSRLDELDARLGLYSRLKKKYGGNTEAVLATLKDSQQRLNDLQTREEQLANFDREEATIREQLMKAGGKLSKKRKKVAESLAEQITEHLRDLGFEHGAFAVELSDDEPKRSGLDAIDFGFQPNAGEEMRPLKSIASSGEISRVMLAVKAVLAEHDRIPLLVFDEIDANVGGEMGNAIGQKMAEVARHHQLVTITHLPQVAVHGSTHFAVAKSVKDGRTYTQVNLLDEQSRAEEIARMLGGKGLTKVTLQHAKEMLKNR